MESNNNISPINPALADLDVSELPVYPAADVFPMLSEWELNELAEDIAINGLNHAIVVSFVDGVFVLIDGRNRREAARLANVPPPLTEYKGNIEEYIYSENITRRHLTTSQRAIAEAQLFPGGQKGNRFTESRAHINDRSTSRGTMRKARALVKEAPDLANQISAGSITVGKAFDSLELQRGRARVDKERLDELKNIAPDLFELVDRGADITEVYAEYRDRLLSQSCNRAAILESFKMALKWFDTESYTAMRAQLIDAIRSDAFTKMLPDETEQTILEKLAQGRRTLDLIIEEF